MTSADGQEDDVGRAADLDTSVERGRRRSLLRRLLARAPARRWRASSTPSTGEHGRRSVGELRPRSSRSADAATTSAPVGHVARRARPSPTRCWAARRSERGDVPGDPGQRERDVLGSSGRGGQRRELLDDQRSSRVACATRAASTQRRQAVRRVRRAGRPAAAPAGRCRRPGRCAVPSASHGRRGWRAAAGRERPRRRGGRARRPRAARRGETLGPVSREQRGEVRGRRPRDRARRSPGAAARRAGLVRAGRCGQRQRAVPAGSTGVGRGPAAQGVEERRACRARRRTQHPERRVDTDLQVLGVAADGVHTRAKPGGRERRSPGDGHTTGRRGWRLVHRCLDGSGGPP